MKKILLAFLLVCSLAYSKENKLSLKVEKETNGGYFLSIPHLEIKDKKDLFIHELNLDLLFTNDRGEVNIPNHHSVKFSNAFGIEYKDIFATFSLDLDYLFAENDSKLKEGLYFGNTFEFGIKF